MCAQTHGKPWVDSLAADSLKWVICVAIARWSTRRQGDIDGVSSAFPEHAIDEIWCELHSFVHNVPELIMHTLTMKEPN